jgi:hypothetical protein
LCSGHSFKQVNISVALALASIEVFACDYVLIVQIFEPKVSVAIFAMISIVGHY